jgi:hypothetical protein
MRLVKRGETTMQQDCFPYALVELKVENDKLPEGLRGEWLLGIACLWWDEGWKTCEPALDTGKPTVLVAWSHPHDGKANYLRTVLVEWQGDDVDLPSTWANLLTRYDFRWAETGPNIFDRMMDRKP